MIGKAIVTGTKGDSNDIVTQFFPMEITGEYINGDDDERREMVFQEWIQWAKTNDERDAIDFLDTTELKPFITFKNNTERVE